MATVAVFSPLEVFLGDLREKGMFLHWEHTRQLQECFSSKICFLAGLGGDVFRETALPPSSLEQFTASNPRAELKVPIEKLGQF